MLKKIMIWLFCSRGKHRWTDPVRDKIIWRSHSGECRFVARECRNYGAVQIQVPSGDGAIFDWMDI